LFHSSYEAGDHIGVFPENDEELVETAAKLLNVDLDKVFTLSPLDKSGRDLIFFISLFLSFFLSFSF
jgi:sulfite reductase alpha subunit-like flavoprotein